MEIFPNELIVEADVNNPQFYVNQPSSFSLTAIHSRLVCCVAGGAQVVVDGPV